MQPEWRINKKGGEAMVRARKGRVRLKKQMILKYKQEVPFSSLHEYGYKGTL